MIHSASNFDSSQEHYDFLRLSERIGVNSDLVQGSGGNTSVKIAGKLLVKASGKWLSDSVNDQIFVQLNFGEYLEKINEFGAQYRPEMGLDETLRPSIETCMHGLMPHKIVLHVHSVNVIAHSVLDEGELLLGQILEGMNWKWVPYCRPGAPLGKSMQKIFSQFRPDVLILANHGLVVGGESCQEVEDLLLEIESRLSRAQRVPKSSPDAEFLKRKAFGLEFHSPRHFKAHDIALDPLSLEIAKGGALYPDHVIFLGPGLCTMGPEESLDFVVTRYEDKYRMAPKYVLIEGKGILVNDKISSTGEEMLLGQVLVLGRIKACEKLCFLEEDEVVGLLGWEAEKYRQLIDKQRG